MKATLLGKMSGGLILAVGAAVLASMFNTTPRVQARNWDGDGETLVRIGYEINPVPLNLQGKDHDLVGLGSFLVNAVADCNGCHTGGGPPNFNYAAGGNPYFNQKAKVDPTLDGGMDFGPVGTPTGPSGYPGPDIIARNLTPDKTGRAEGGHTREQFKQIIRQGTDFDHIHPTCAAAQVAQIEAGVDPAAGLHSHFTGQYGRRESSASDAMANVCEYDRPSARRYLRVSERHPLHRQLNESAARRRTE
jgi:hypothetical protein